MIVNEEQHRAMKFIAEVNRGGHRPTGRQINEWRLRPDPKPGRTGKLVTAEVPAVPERRVRKEPYPFGSAIHTLIKSQAALSARLSNQWSALARANLTGLNSPVMLGMANNQRLIDQALGVRYETIPARPGKPAVYGAERSPERFLAHLRRLEWIERDAKGGYGVTLLGHALLRSEASSELGDDDSSVMVLAADDELAYGRVMGVISECGDAFIMDAYLGTEEMINILKHSSASRFLVGDKLPKNRLTELAVLIELTPIDSGAVRELRQAAFHDRWVVGDHKVYGLGASINGVGGKSPTTLIEMPDEAARFIREAAEDLWAGAKVRAETRQDSAEPDDEADSQPADTKATSVREEQAVFRHDGCDIRHTSQRTAENCTHAR